MYNKYIHIHSGYIDIHFDNYINKIYCKTIKVLLFVQFEYHAHSRILNGLFISHQEISNDEII